MIQVTPINHSQLMSPEGALGPRAADLTVAHEYATLGPKYDQFELFPYKVELENIKGMYSYPQKHKLKRLA